MGGGGAREEQWERPDSPFLSFDLDCQIYKSVIAEATCSNLTPIATSEDRRVLSFELTEYTLIKSYCSETPVASS